MARTWPSIRRDLVQGRGEFVWPRPGPAVCGCPGPLLRRPGDRDRRRLRPLGPRPPSRVPPGRRDAAHHPLRRRGRARAVARRQADAALATARRRAVPVHVRPRGRLDAPVHRRRRARRPARRARHRTRQPGALLGLGSDPDQYGRRWDGDDLEDQEAPPDPQGSDLPPLRRGWGTYRRVMTPCGAQADRWMPQRCSKCRRDDHGADAGCTTGAVSR